jgi:hypothetical protein
VIDESQAIQMKEQSRRRSAQKHAHETEKNQSIAKSQGDHFCPHHIPKMDKLNSTP